MDVAILTAAEATRWSIVFHRQAENRLFAMLAMGHFKHVSAFAWLPGPRVWIHYDLGFRRTRVVVLPDTAESKAYLAALITGNAIVTMKVRGDARPVMRLGLFCTSAVKHLIGLRSSALRPDALFASCLRHGGKLSDDASQNHPAAGRPNAGAGAAAGSASASLHAANAG
jgi:hypothetical protein